MTHGPRPVWLFSLDSENFHAAPTTTGGLIAWYRVNGSAPAGTDFRQVHFRERGQVAEWAAQHLPQLAAEARHAHAAGLEPVAGFSFYTWNAAEFLELTRLVRAACPQILIVAGGPHVQQAETYLGTDPIDAIVIGEGEATFQEMLDTPRALWPAVPGIACLDADGALLRSPRRERQLRLEELPSPFDVIELRDARGQPLYDAVSYETTRGCPYKCAFCEWGTGAIGTRMVSFPLERLRRDWEKIVRAGIANIWLADSNFGALREDVEKARMICELKQRFGLPRTFATSWSKKHSPRVQEIVLMLHENGLLPFYQLALQTLTPLALQLCHRENMAANVYEPIAQRMAQAGIPISAELIWGLPGDDLASFERNLDRLLAKFPSINIFGYTLLPGTEFHERREEYRIQTLPVAGYGKAKGEYVVGCHTFDRAEGEEGYFLITAHLLLVSGHILPATVRYLAMRAEVPVGSLLRAVADALLVAFERQLPGIERGERMQVYAARDEIYLTLLQQPERCEQVVRDTVRLWLASHAADAVAPLVESLLDIDCMLRPRCGEEHEFSCEVCCDAQGVLAALGAMRIPGLALFDGRPRQLQLSSPGGLGVVLKSPDGGIWLQSRIRESSLGEAGNAELSELVFN
ncbi:MAG: B12-binding domain-containing radical SAM protein [Gammaproteobacteria bacterium]|nr:B12-binding domain-containing radical SAM protein [Gammaproteobacteria bacterium]